VRHELDADRQGQEADDPAEGAESGRAELVDQRRTEPQHDRHETGQDRRGDDHTQPVDDPGVACRQRDHHSDRARPGDQRQRHRRERHVRLRHAVRLLVVGQRLASHDHPEPGVRDDQAAGDLERGQADAEPFQDKRAEQGEHGQDRKHVDPGHDRLTPHRGAIHALCHPREGGQRTDRIGDRQQCSQRRNCNVYGLHGRERTPPDPPGKGSLPCAMK
jgi:hypothetical protein